MEERVSYAVVGLFVLLLGAGFVAFVLWLSAGAFFAPPQERYLAFMRESVSGLSVNAPVKYRGVDVGRVRDIELNPVNPEEVRLELDIEVGTPIKTDTVAVLSVQGLTGIAFIDLTGGSRDAPILRAAPDEPYPVIETGPSLFVRLDAAVSQLMTSVGQVAEDLGALLADGNREAFARVLNNLDGVTGALADNREVFARVLNNLDEVTGALAENRDAFGTAVQSAATALERSAEATAGVPQLLDRVGRSAQAIERMATEVAQVSSGLGGAIEDGGQDLRRFTAQTLPEVALLISELREMTATLQRVGHQLERDPSMLLRGARPLPPGPGE